VIGVVIDRRNSFHVATLRESVTANSLIGQERIAGSAANWLARTGDLAYAKLQALAQLAAQIQQQAAVMTYSETFYLLAVALLACIPLALLLRTPAAQPANPSSAGH
jgi:DHA2 family multidrug resistance protein